MFQVYLAGLKMFYTVGRVLVGATTDPTKSDETGTVVRVRVKRDGSSANKAALTDFARKVINDSTRFF